MIVGVTMVKNEADIIGTVLEHLYAEGVDEIIVADNQSTDGTRDILERSAAVVVADPEPGYWQADKMTRLTHMAGDLGATWIVPFDADEVWYADGRTLAETFEVFDHGEVDKVAAVGWDHLRTHNDPAGPPIQTTPHRRPDPQPLPKIAFRYRTTARLHMGNHDVDGVGGRTFGALKLRHFQYRSLDHYKRKLRDGKTAYDATTIPATFGAHWRQGGAKSDADLETEWDELCRTEGLVYDPAPLRR